MFRKLFLLVIISSIFVLACQNMGEDSSPQNIPTWKQALLDLDSSERQTASKILDTLALRHESLSDHTELLHKIAHHFKFLNRINASDTLEAQRMYEALQHYKLENSPYYPRMLNLIAYEYHKAGNRVRAIDLFKRSNEIGIKMGNDTAVLLSSIYLGNIYNELSRYAEALVVYKTAEQLSEKMNDSFNLQMTRANLANLYMYLEIPDKAVEIHKTMLEYPRIQRDTSLFIQTLSSIGQCYVVSDSLKNGLAFSDKSISLLRQYNSRNQKDSFVVLSTRGIIHFAAKNFDSSQSCFEEAQRLAYITGYSYGAYRMELNRLKCLNRKRQFQKALEAFNSLQRLDFLPSLGHHDKLEFHEEGSLLFKGLKRDHESIAYLDSVIMFTDSLKVKDEKYKIVRQEADLMMESARLKLDLQEEQIKRAAKERKLSVWLASISFTLLMVLFIIFNTERRKKMLVVENKLRREFNEKLLSGIEKEKRELALDLHDVIAPKVLLLKQQLPGTYQEQMNDLILELGEIGQRIYPVHLNKVGLVASIKSLCHEYDKLYDIYFSIELDESAERFLDHTQQLHVYRIVQEVLNNVIKHSRAEAVKLSLCSKTGQFCLEIRDNGIGFNVQEMLKNNTRLGLDSIRYRAELIRAQIDWQSTPQKGTTFKLSIT